MPQKFGPIEGRRGSALYPGFNNTVPVLAGRLLRLERGSQRVQRGQIRPTFRTTSAPNSARRGLGGFTRLPSSILIKAGGLTNQKLNLAHPNVRTVGSIPPAGNSLGFAYTSTTTSITWFWDGTNGSHVITIHRADGTVFRVPTAGSGFTVTGLLANTTYYFLPFWNPANACNIGWVQGTHGSPQVAFVLSDTTDPQNSPIYLIEQSFQGLEPLSAGFLSGVTPMSGSGGGGGGGRGCVMSGTDIQTLGDLSYSCTVLPETQWVHLQVEDGRFLNCTVDHPLYHAFNGRTDARQLKEGELVIMDDGERRIVTIYDITRKCSKYKVEMAEGHLYYANGFLSHNQKIVP